jgi:L-amino acid N-acyltransferase YncA
VRPAPVHVRPALPRDAAAIAAIYAPYVRDTAVTFETDPPDEAEIASRMRRGMLTHPWLVAHRGAATIGYAYSSRHRERAGYRWTVETSVYVAQREHRGGVGRMLYVALLDELAAMGFHLALAGICLPNEQSVAFHESMGFRQAALYEKIGWKLGAWRDVGWWTRELAPRGEGAPMVPLTLADPEATR